MIESEKKARTTGKKGKKPDFLCQLTPLIIKELEPKNRRL